MAVRLGVICAERQTAMALAAHSRTALDRPLECPAELWVAVAADEARIIGAFQRASGKPEAPPLARRGSGGPEVLVGEGTVHVALALVHPGALVSCDETRIVNRYVRPLLRALNRTVPGGILAHFFGRDWISVAHRPAAWVGFGHDAATRRTLFEAFIAVQSPFAAEQRASFRGKPQGTLASIAGCPVDPADLAASIVEAYGEDAERVPLAIPPVEPRSDDPWIDPPWAATSEEIIGTLGAGHDARGIFRVGGDLLVSRDALARLEASVAPLGDGDLAGLVDRTLAAPGVALDGVRSLASVCDVIARARR